jgi:hypothetical protein
MVPKSYFEEKNYMWAGYFSGFEVDWMKAV